MAAAIKAINARIRANPVLDYVCSTHFWGPVSNFGIPLAAIMDTQKDPELISGRMTGTLALYSAVFSRYSMAVTPKNYLLLACHVTNFSSQCIQLYRWQNYWYQGGKEKQLAEQAKSGAEQLKESGKQVMDEAKDMAGQAKAKVQN